MLSAAPNEHIWQMLKIRPWFAVACSRACARCMRLPSDSGRPASKLLMWSNSRLRSDDDEEEEEEEEAEEEEEEEEEGRRPRVRYGSPWAVTLGTARKAIGVMFSLR